MKRGDKAVDKGNEAEDSQTIIICPGCGHVNLTLDKCSKCGKVFSDEDMKKLGIEI